MEEAAGHEPIIIDERWLTEWFEYGWANLNIFLARHANFDAWCVDHERSLDG